MCKIIFVLLFFCFNGNAQIFMDEYKPYNVKTDILFIPSVSFSYNIMMDEFLAKNNGLELKRKMLLPEVYINGQIIVDGWSIGLGYGFFQKSIMLTTGRVFKL